MGISIMPHSSSQMSDTFPGPVSTIISPLQLLSFWKLSSSPSLNKFNRLTERQPDAPCWLSKGLRWDNIMVCKAHMEHFRCLMGENSNLSHKWQFSMNPQSHTEKLWNSNKGMKQTQKRRLTPNATTLVWLLKRHQLLKNSDNIERCVSIITTTKMTCGFVFKR